MSRSARPRRSAAAAAAAALERGDGDSRAASPAEETADAPSPSPAADSDSSLSSLSDEEPVPKRGRGRGQARSRAERPGGGARTRRTRTARAPLATPADNELFSAVVDANNDDAAENWVVLFQTDPADAVAQLATLALRLAGCPAAIDRESVTDTDAAADTVAGIEAEYAEHASAQYPVAARARGAKHVRRAAEELLARVVQGAAEADVATHDAFLPALLPWLCALAASTLRALRHTATLVVLWLLRALSTLRDATQGELAIAERQLSAEQHKALANETRLAHMQAKADALDDAREFVDTRIDELVDSVFVPRFRDLDAAIRADCMVQLEALCAAFPGQYLQTFYFRLIGGALLDPDTAVRLHALRAVHGALAGAHAELARPFVSEYRRRLVDIALGDVEMSVRTAAFALLERASAHDMLDSSERSALAVHVFDIEPRIRVAAAAFLAALLGTNGDEAARVRRLVGLLVQYRSQLDALDDDAPAVLDDEDVPLLTASIGSIGIALDALWTAAPELRTWSPYLEVLLDESGLAPAEEGVAVEALLAATSLVPRFTEDPSAMEACTTALIDGLPRLLARFATDAPRLTDLVLVPRYMDLDVFAETRNVAAFDTLWHSVCTHFLRHIEPMLLRNAAQSLRMLAAAHVSLGSGPARMHALIDTVLGSLLGALGGRSLDTAVFTEDDMHNVRAGLLRIYALASEVDIGLLRRPPTDMTDVPWTRLVAFAHRGRLGQAREVQPVRVALKTLALALMWRIKGSEHGDISDLTECRDSLLAALYVYTGNTDAHIAPSLRTTACHLAAVLHTLLFAAGADAAEDTALAPLQLPFPAHVQQQCADTLQSELGHALEHCTAAAGADAPQRGRKSRRDAGLAPLGVLVHQRRINSLAAPLVDAVRVGAMDIKHTPVMLGYYACFDNAFNALCHDLVSVLRDDALHLQRAWVVCAALLEALKHSFGRHVAHPGDAAETAYVSLSRHLANATMVRGPGFTVIERVDADAMTTLHVSGIQFVLQAVQDGTDAGVACVFFKGLANLLATVSPGDALKIHSSLRHRLAAASMEPDGAKWEPLSAYERRLLNLASKDPGLLQEATATHAPTDAAAPEDHVDAAQ